MSPDPEVKDSPIPLLLFSYDFQDCKKNHLYFLVHDKI